MSKDEKEEIDEKALTSIQLSLSNKVLWEVVHEKTAVGFWLKLESLYMIKTLANRLHLKQNTMTLSTIEAQYMVAAERMKEAMWLRGLFAELSPGLKVIIVHCNSQSSIYLTKDQMHNERTKDIDVRYHFIREVIAQEDILVKKINTTDNSTDMKTKPLPLIKFKDCVNLVGLCST